MCVGYMTTKKKLCSSLTKIKKSHLITIQRGNECYIFILSVLESTQYEKRF
jgi:hypothetical protein